VLVVLLRTPVSDYFAGRRTEVKGNLDAAAELLEQAETRHTEWQRKMIDLDADLETIRRESRERAEHERDQILADARASADRIQHDATVAVDQELRRARSDLQREASELAVELAEKILREQVVDSDRDRLADEFISQLSRPATEAR
jgi:F-type H+-transporting ATPase subunit b